MDEQLLLIRVLRACLLCLALSSSACAHFTAGDKPLSHWTPEQNRRTSEQVAGDRSPELLVLVAFSGGGTRAAAFSYGVLQELASSEVTTERGPRPLLHEIDLISSVSGGSFTSAYYGLYGDRIFEEFEDRFLRKDVERELLWQLFKPTNWFRLLSATYGRSDLAAEYYNKNLFNGETFADLQRRDAPFVFINSTDLATGMRFSFTQVQFDLICADLSQYPLSRAVAASSAVPVLLSPITMKSYAGSCGYEPPEWLGEALKDEGHTHRKMEARGLEDYLDHKKRPWLHLVDGGIADNLGLRSFYNIVSLTNDPRLAFRKLGHPDVRQILMISVDAHARVRSDWALKKYAPSLFEVIGNISADQIERYSIDTIEIVRSSYEKWTEQISTAERPVTFNFVEVNFDAVRDDASRRYLNEIGTNFNLKDKQVDRLISAAREVLRNSPDFQAFIKRNQVRGDRP